MAPHASIDEGYDGHDPTTEASAVTSTLANEAAPHNAGKEDIVLTDQTNLLPFKRIVAVFLGLGLCALVSTLDSTIVATALPSISADFKAGSVSSWVPSAYLLTSTAFQPLCQ